MGTKLLEWAAILACLWGLSGLAWGAGIRVADDLRQDAASAAAQSMPVLLLFSRTDCTWCKKVRRQHLEPLARQSSPLVLIRQIDVDADRPLIDFAGKATTHQAFAARQQARLTPTVMLFGASGEPLSEGIVGYRLADFYGAYLEQAIADSRARLEAARRP